MLPNLTCSSIFPVPYLVGLQVALQDQFLGKFMAGSLPRRRGKCCSICLHFPECQSQIDEFLLGPHVFLSESLVLTFEARIIYKNENVIDNNSTPAKH